MFKFGVQNYEYDQHGNVINADMFVYFSKPNNNQNVNQNVNQNINNFIIKLNQEDINIFTSVIQHPDTNYPQIQNKDIKLRYNNGTLFVKSDAGKVTKVREKAYINFMAYEVLSRFNIEL